METKRLSFWGFIRLWWSAATKGSWDRVGLLSTIVGAVVWVWHKYYAASFDRAVAYVGWSPEAAVTDLVWQLPLGVGGLALAWRFVRAPYEIHLETVTSREAVTAELDRSRAQNKGIELACSHLALSWEKAPELPAGVVIAVDVARIVNANTYDAAVAIKLVAPLWRLGPIFTASVSSRPLVSPVSIVKSKLPQLPPLVNLGAKKALGPGLFVFFFSCDAIKGYEFAPEPQDAVTPESLAKLFADSEMYIEMTDVANRVVLPPVLLPGTAEKRSRRLETEQGNPP